MTELPGRGATAAGTGRRRFLTIVFSDLTASTRLAAEMETEDYAAMLAQLRHACEAVIPAHGGTILRIQGDGLLAIFGHPQAGEDDGRRATQAVLDLHERVSDLRVENLPPWLTRLGMHSGIHAGLVLLDEGDVVRGRYELIGDAANIAARLADAAAAGEILVSEETLGVESHFFQTGARRVLELRGRAEPLAVVPILGRAAVANRFEARARRGLVPFVGRQRELRMLEAGRQDALAGGPCHLVIAASAGVGKTRLSQEFLARCAEAGCDVHRGYCESFLSAEPLQPFLQMLRALLGMHAGVPAAEATEALDRCLAGIDPALAAHRGELLRALSLDVAVEDARGLRVPADGVVAALRDLFDRLAARRPQVIFIDDLQWADKVTRQVLGALRTLEHRPILLLAATRSFSPGDSDLVGARILELAPFSEAETAQTVAQLLERSDPQVATRIQKYSGGNPLYVEELCHSAAHRDIDRELSRATIGSAWLDTLIESRVARLPVAQSELVRAAAVIGNVIPAWLLERITGHAPDDPLVQGLAEQDFIFPGDASGTLRFKHGIARDVIYDSVGLHARRALHRQVAEALRERNAAGVPEEIYESLAHHYGCAGQAGEAAQYAELAGDKAVAASALDRAQAQYLAALAALDRLEPTDQNYRRWGAIAQRLGLVCVFDPSKDQLAVLQRAVERATARGDRAAVARAEYWLGYVNYALGESRVAIPHLERALTAAQGIGDDPLVVQIRATLGQARVAVNDYERALPLLDEGIAVKRRHRSGSRPAVGLSFTLTCKATLLADRGLFAQAQECFDEALEAVRGANHEVEASVLGFRSAAFLWQGRPGEALHCARAALQVAERVKSLFIAAADRALAAYASWLMDPAPGALQTIVDATEWLDSRDRRLNISLNYGWLAEAMVASGRRRELRHYAARAMVRARHHDRLGHAMSYRALARGAAQAKDAARAQRYVALALRAAALRGSPHEDATTCLCAAEIALGEGDRGRALALLDRAETAFLAMDMLWHLGEARRLRARL